MVPRRQGDRNWLVNNKLENSERGTRIRRHAKRALLHCEYANRRTRCVTVASRRVLRVRAWVRVRVRVRVRATPRCFPC